LFASDVLKVLYAPHKVFKEIVQNPKYWGPLLVFILVVAAQSGFYYAQSEKIYYEQTYPTSDQLGLWTTNTTLWTAYPGISISNNYVDYLNSSYYGNGTINGSIQFDAQNMSSVSMAIPSFTSVDCTNMGFQNLSLRVKQVIPSSTPTQVTVTLYSQSNSNYYQYDLTNQFTNASIIGYWNNITIPVGASASGWQSNGNPQWGNITGLKLDFNYASANNISLRMTGLFFRSEYKTFAQISVTGLFITVLQQSLFEFIFEWLFLTGLMYIILKGLKVTITWKPLFIIIGFVLIVTAVTAVISIVATQTLPIIHSPIELQTQLPGEADIQSAALAVQTQTYTIITGIVQLITYVWIVALGALGIRALQPELSITKCMLASAAALVVTVILMSLLGV